MERSIRTYKNAVSIVTGGASGIGRALGTELASRGSDVILADIDPDMAEKVADSICNRGGKALSCRADVRNLQDLEDIVEKTLKRRGRIDYIFNNAGIAVAGESHLHTGESWKKIIDVNLLGVANGIQAVYPVMKEQRFGHIINTASMAGLIPIPTLAAYSATKHAVVGLSKCLRIEGASWGIRVSALCPGVIRTPILEGGGRHGTLHGVSENEIQKALSFPVLKPMDAAILATEVLDDVARNRSIIVIPRWWRVLWWISRVVPTHLMYSIDRAAFSRVRASWRDN